MSTRTTVNTTQNYWMPFTPNRAFLGHPRMLVKAEGMYYWNDKGEKLIDGCAGLYTHAAGHCHPKIVDAIRKQAAELDYAMAFQFGHPGAFELASRISAMTPGDLNHVFFANSGSEAVDTALKIALAYHKANGEGQRVRVVGRERGYHGVNMGGTSLGGMVKNKESFGPGLPGVHHLRHTHIGKNRFVKGQGDAGADLADDLERFALTYGPDTIAACIVEPIAGSGGILVPPKGYLERLRAICDKYGILLIFDEVICGFGRTGEAFGAQSFGVTPDIMTLAKALTNGSVPMGAAVVSDEIYQTVMDAAPEGAIELYHGYTYSGHPLACAAGLAAMDVYRDEDLFARAKSLSPAFLDQVFALEELDVVTDIRGYGMLAAVDMAPEGKNGTPGKRGQALTQWAFDNGMVLRVGGDTAILAPALIATGDELSQLVEILKQGLKQF